MCDKINDILTTRKIIFLDFDGVVTNIHDSAGSYWTHLPKNYGYSKSNLDLLLELCQKEDAYIVISSNWRKFEDSGNWKFNWRIYSNPLPKLIEALGNRYICCLPKIRHKTKAEVLELFFKDNQLEESSVNYVILDDDLKENYQNSIFKNRFILTNKYLGLQKEDCEKISKIFNSQEIMQ